MFAKIEMPKSIHNLIYYNENKIGKSLAACIQAANFLKDAHELNLAEKKQRFDHQMALNQRVQCHTLNIILSFTPGEQIANNKMIDITEDYMQQIGFGEQPYLVYRHFDMQHPHLHVVTTSIRADGSSIDLGYIDTDRSGPAQKAIEEKYGLIKAQRQKKVQQFGHQPLPPERLQYGKRPTKEAITNALEYILENYRFRSLPELNAILKLYNLKANPGKPGSWIHQHGGLIYQMLDEKGVGVGVPIKASSIYFKPGLKWLEAKFSANQTLDPTVVQRIRLAVEGILKQQPTGWASFTNALRREQIAAIPYSNPAKSLSELSFVDLDRKVVVQASELGKTLDILFRPEEQALKLPYELSQKSKRQNKLKP
jgi:hypothetical protein